MNTPGDYSLSAETLSSSRWRPRLLVGGGLLALLVGVALGIWVYADYAAERRIREAVAEIDRREPDGWRFEELEARRIVLTDERNAAVCVMAVKRLLPSPWPPVPKPLPEPVGPPTPVGGAPDDPPPGGPEVVVAPSVPGNPPQPLNTRVDQVAPEHRFDDALVGEMRDALTAAGPAVARARELAALKQGRFPVVWAPDLISTVLTCQDAREVVRLMSFDAALRGHDGDADGALESCRAALNAGRAIGDEPTFISQLVRVACQAVAVRAAERALAQGQASPEALEAALRALREEADEPLLLYAARGERAGLFRVLSAMAAGDVAFSRVAGGGGAPAVSEFMARGWARQAIPDGLRLMTELVEVARLPAERQAEAAARWEQSVKAEVSGNFSGGGVLIRLLVPAGTKVAEACRRNQSVLRVAVVGVAAERYRRDRGRWPDTLDKLAAAGYLDGVPLDPYDGRPLRFRWLGDGAVVYSVGPDGKDDNGTINRENILAPGSDLGFRLWNVPQRGQAPKPPKEAPDAPGKP